MRRQCPKLVGMARCAVRAGLRRNSACPVAAEVRVAPEPCEGGTRLKTNPCPSVSICVHPWLKISPFDFLISACQRVSISAFDLLISAFQLLILKYIGAKIVGLLFWT